MIPVTGNGLLSLLRDFKADGRSKADTALAAGYVRNNGKPAFTAFYEAVLEARGITLDPSPPGGIDRTCRNGPAIYVACLASYNANRLFGSWLDLSDGPDAGDIREAIDAIIKESPEPFAEEYAIHDSQDLPGFLAHTEWPDIDKLADYCQNRSELGDDDAAAYRVACNLRGTVLSLSEFRDAHQGWWERPERFAIEAAENSGYLKDEATNPLLTHVDWEGYWRDLAQDYSAFFIESRGEYLILSDA